MDTTEDYKRMCEKADEIQNSWKRKHGDYYYDCFSSGINLYHSTYFLYPDKNKDIWLPRQDQLQEVAIRISELWIHVLNRFYEYYTEQIQWNHEWHSFFNTPEMMWLAFVMNEEFDKVWDGKDWIRDREEV